MSKEVEDRGSKIRVTAVRAIPVGRKGYLKIETNMGVTGWGEINNIDSAVACALAESMSEMVIGENPTETGRGMDSSSPDQPPRPFQKFVSGDRWPPGGLLKTGL